MLATQTINALSTLIESAVEQTKELYHLLENEQQALLSEDHEALENLIEQKLRVSQSLDHVEIQRQEIMANAGQSTDNAFMPRFLLANQANSEFKPLLMSWGNLMAWLKKSASQNQLNGILLEKQRQHVQRALNILFEQSNTPPVYDAVGGTAQQKFTRSVGVA